MFAAAFTAPGGNNNNTGIPMFRKHSSFMVFAISDAIALVTSSTSILMFLSILTSRYAENDFVESLPFKLMIGLTTLFISITTMMVAFCATFFIVFDRYMVWVPIAVALFACVPIILFATLQYPLLADVIHSTYASRNELQKTPFWYVIQALTIGRMDPRKSRKSDDDVVAIIQRYNEKSKAFTVGKKNLTFTTNDMTLIFGLQRGK
ncbi:unnamed protein product [Camellia sinensis]